MKNNLLFVILIVVFTTNAFTQELEHKKDRKKNLFTFTLGYTYIPKGTSFGAEEGVIGDRNFFHKSLVL